MGFIEEGRQLIQDFVTPEIRSLDARLTALEKKIESMEGTMDRNHGQVMDTLHRIENYNQLAERLARLESKMQHVA
jgi:tetrahydromethanopterin S-methyltransferase subunit G